MYIDFLKQKLDDRNQHTKNTTSDLSQLRPKAVKSTYCFGQFLMPFAFGMTPLVQIIGSTLLLIPTNRAIQSALFKS